MKEMNVENKKTKILVIDDDVDFLNPFVAILEKEGYNVQSTSNAILFEEIVSEYDPDLLIIDKQIPIRTGTDLSHWIKSTPEHKHRYIIMISGCDTTDDKIFGIDSGADDYIVKPFSYEELFARIRAGMRFLHIQSELAEQVRRNARMELACTVADRIGNPLAAARFLLQSMKTNPLILNDPKINETVQSIDRVVLEALTILIEANRER
ncbi:MAG: response regulator transcription factor [bacterium]